jgi:hypothetical protein
MIRFLIYPLGPGDGDDDPEDLIYFYGTEAYPHYAPWEDRRKWRRGQVLIDFFGLNREGLQRGRAEWLRYAVWQAFLLASQGDPTGQRALTKVTHPQSPFTHCARCFLQLCREYRSVAEVLIREFELAIEANP